MNLKLIATHIVQSGLRHCVEAEVPFHEPVVLGSDQKTYELSQVELRLTGEVPKYQCLEKAAATNGVITRDFMLRALIALLQHMDDHVCQSDFYHAVNEILTCSLTQQRIEHPVTVFGTGQTYEFDAIQKWFEEHGSDPINTRTKLTEAQRLLIHNQILQKIIDLLQVYEHSPLCISFPIKPMLTEITFSGGGIYSVLPLNSSQFVVGSFLYAYVVTKSGPENWEDRQSALGTIDPKIIGDGKQHGGEVVGLCRLADGGFVTASPYTVCEWKREASGDFKIEREFAVGPGHTLTITNIHDDQQLALSTGRQDIEIRDVKSGKLVKKIADSDADVDVALVSLEKGHVLRKGFFTAAIWDVDSATVLQELKDYRKSEEIRSVCYLGLERGIVLGISNGDIILYQRDRSTSLYSKANQFKVGSEPVSQLVAMEPPYFASLSCSSTEGVSLRIWDETQFGARPVNRVEVKSSSKSLLAYLGDGRLLVADSEKPFLVHVLVFRV